jgi:hypothetical protein
MSEYPLTADTETSCVACDSRATHVNASGERLCEDHRDAETNFALLAERRKKAFDMVMSDLDVIRLKPGKSYPNTMAEVIYPDCGMCGVRTCAAKTIFSNRGAILKVEFTCSKPECQEAWKTLNQAHVNMTRLRGLQKGAL